MLCSGLYQTRFLSPLFFYFGTPFVFCNTTGISGGKQQGD